MRSHLRVARGEVELKGVGGDGKRERPLEDGAAAPPRFAAVNEYERRLDAAYGDHSATIDQATDAIEAQWRAECKTMADRIISM